MPERIDLVVGLIHRKSGAVEEVCQALGRDSRPILIVSICHRILPKYSPGSWEKMRNVGEGG